MTKEQEKELLPIRQAFVDGKSIQVCLKSEDRWCDVVGDCPNFENLCWKWRVKPEPREFWLVAPKRSSKTPFSVWYYNPPEHTVNRDESEIIHVREVLE